MGRCPRHLNLLPSGEHPAPLCRQVAEPIETQNFALRQPCRPYNLLYGYGLR
jgi:hypothetical protein